jgi:HAD superfamily hydrolase (TIGR01509 family)
MDGTITRPMLDFDAIRAEIGISGPILEAIGRMTVGEQKRANEILDRHEQLAAVDSELNEGCRELLAEVAAQNLPTAIITRNSRPRIDIVLAKHGLTFDVLICRDAAPPKPDPRSITTACAALGVRADECWMIGDGHHDIEAGIAAGSTTVWVSHGSSRDFVAEPHLTIRGLSELIDVLRNA